jgi:FkbM family methyltransferase
MKISSSKIKHLIIEKILWPLSFWGAKEVGIDDVDNAILKLNRSTALGKRCELIYVPRDGHILNNIKKYSVWAGEEVEFLAKRYSEIMIENSKQSLTFIDAGAHCGLVSRQFALVTGFRGRAILVEPVQQHAVAIRKNLDSIVGFNNFEIVQAALGKKGGQFKIFKENNNSGNTSLLRSLVPTNNSTEIDIKVISAYEFSKKVSIKDEAILLKCDLQGLDAQVLANFSEQFWKNLDSAVIEVLANQEIESKDVEQLIERLEGFSYKSWKPGEYQLTDTAEIKEFWLSKSGLQRNLYIKKSTNFVTI